LDGDTTPQEHVEGRSSGSLVSGNCPGIYAIGHVTGPFVEVFTVSDDWMKPGERGNRCHLCPLEWTESRVNHPILKADLLAAGGFEKARIIDNRWPRIP
jgi:hypothetical protein